MADTTVAFNPFEPGFTDDPYPQYQRMRAGDPVHHSEIGIWVIFGYDDVLHWLRDSTLSVEQRNAHRTALDDLAEDAIEDYVEQDSLSMLDRDPPDHTRLRRLVSKAFTPRMIQQLRPRVEEIVDATLADARERAAGEPWDLIEGLAFPLPFQVISELLGTPATDTARIREWSGTLVRGLEPVVDPDVLRAIIDASRSMEGAIRDIVAWKRTHMSDDLMSGLIAVEEDGESLTEQELIDQVALLYIAGHETTVNLIGNGTLALLRHRAQLERLRADPSLDANAIEELLRFDSPVQMTRRITLAPIEIAGQTIEPGAFVLLGLGSANRDQAHWGDTADELDIGRTGANAHMAFGGGHHHCLGAALARLEGQVAIGSLARAFPHMELAAEPAWNGRINLRGLRELPLALASTG
ncbi:MAG: cytochrome P450 [Acidimicrobiaceae bacterium]|nr:cytochrome P450 [Acidimicrobiaceae bacterium]